MELLEKSYFGYFFSQDQLNQGEFSSWLYVFSTFSYYQWRMMDHIVAKKINTTDLPLQAIRDLAYVQLPNGNTLLHMLYKDKVALDYMFDALATDPDVEDDCLFYVPILKDIKGKTALDHSLTKKSKNKVV